MPMYEYVCEKCDLAFEELVTGGSVPKCPGCKSAKLRRKLSVPSSPHGKAPANCAAADAGACQPRGHSCSGGCCHHH